MAKKKKTLKDNESFSVDADSSSEALTAEDVSKKYTVAELKYILKENGLKVSGKKQDLVERALPILNGDSVKTSGGAKKAVLEQTEEVTSPDDAEAPVSVNMDPLSSALGIFGINYDDLDIKDEIVKEGKTDLSIQGFTQDGLSMSDATMSIVNDSDSSGVNLKMNLPEVSYTNFENTVFTFNNLDLFVLPSSDPKSLEFSALMDSLEIITETNYVNLKGLNLLFKAFPDEGGVRLDIDISNFLYPNFNDTTFNFEDLHFNMAMGLDGQNLDLSVNLPKLNLINKDYKVKLSDLNINIVLPDLKLSNLDLSILMSDFQYTNFDDVYIDMDNVDVSLEPILDSNSFDVIIHMDAIDATGVTFDEMFPMLNINSINFKKPTTDSESPVNLIGSISPLDIYNLDLSSIASLLTSGFDIDAYTSSMMYYDSSLDVDADDISGTDVSGFDIAGIDLGAIFENFDYSSLDAVVLDLSRLIDSAGIDLVGFGIDLSDYDLSAISLADIIDVINDSGVMSTIAPMLNLFSIDLENLDMSGLISNFDADKFDISSLLSSLNLDDLDISAVLGILNNPDLNLGSIFENCDYSCLGAIELDLSGLIESAGIDLSCLGIDLSDYDLSAISLSDLIALLNSPEIMASIEPMLNLFSIDWDNLDMSGLISSFDADNFDMSSLIASLNLSGSDLSGILEMLTDSEFTLDSIFENCDYSCLDAIELDLSGLIEAAGIDVDELGIDMSSYDLSAIKLSNLIDILKDPDFDMSKLDLSDLDLENLDMSGLVTSFDINDFDMSDLISGLNLSGSDISGILEMFNNSDFDLESIFENCDYSCLGAFELDLSSLVESAGIDLAGLGIDLSDYDLSAISLSDVVDILNNSGLDIESMLKLSGLELDNLDLSGLISSFDTDNFDMSALLSSLNLYDLDLSAILEMFNNPDFDLGSVFENCDYSCLGAFELDLSGLVESAGIDLAGLGIDLSDYDLSAISLSDVIDVINNSGIMDSFAPMLELFTLDWDNLDMSDLIVSFDADDLDISALLTSLNVSGLDIEGMLEMFNMNGFDITEFLNMFLGSFMVENDSEAIASE